MVWAEERFVAEVGAAAGALLAVVVSEMVIVAAAVDGMAV